MSAPGQRRSSLERARRPAVARTPDLLHAIPNRCFLPNAGVAPSVMRPRTPRPSRAAMLVLELQVLYAALLACRCTVVGSLILTLVFAEIGL